jgi:hypothetical protein
MTDRVKSLTVVLDKDIRVDDVESLVNAIRCIRHVMSVGTNIVDSDDYAARERVAFKWSDTIFDVMAALRDGRKVTIEEPSSR